MSYQLDQTSFPKLLCGCHKQRLSGTLLIKHQSVNKSVYLEDGAVIYASSNIISERFGERLRALGRITNEQFELVMMHVRDGSQQLGGSLIDLGVMKEAELQALLLDHVCQLIYSLFPWEEGEYEFKPGRIQIKGFHFPMPTADIIFQGIRLIPKMTLIKRWLGNFDQLIVPTSDPFLLFQTVNLKPEEAYIISRLDAPMSLNDLLSSLTGIDIELLLRTICALKMSGIVEAVQGEAPPPLLSHSIAESVSSPEAQAQIDAAAAAQLCFDLAEVLHNIDQNADHYQVLGVNRRATADEIKRAFREQAKKFHPDRHSQLAAFDFQVKNELEKVFIRIQAAYGVLSDEAKRRKYDATLRFPTVVPPGQPSPPTRPTGSFAPVPTSPPGPAKPSGSSFPKMNSDPPRPTTQPGSPYSTPKPYPNPAANQPQPPAAKPPYPNPAYPQQRSPYSTPPSNPTYPPQPPPSPYSTPKPFPNPMASQPPPAPPPAPSSSSSTTPIYNLEQKLLYSTPSKAASKSTGGTAKLPSSPSTSTGSHSIPTKPATPSSTPASNPALPAQPPPASSYSTPPASPYSTPPNPFSPPTAQPPPVQPPAPPRNPSGAYSTKEINTNLTASEHYMKCIEYTGTQDYERALQSIRRAVELRPKNTEYHAQMARVLIHMPGHNKQAEKEFLIAIELDAENPDLPDLFVELSDLYRKFGMAQRADEMLQRALDKDPTHHDANQRLEKYAPPPETGWKKTGGRFGALVGKMFNKDKGNT